MMWDPRPPPSCAAHFFPQVAVPFAFFCKKFVYDGLGHSGIVDTKINLLLGGKGYNGVVNWLVRIFLEAKR